MNCQWTQTKASLKRFFEILACGKCKKTPERPMRLITCGHMFCDTCCTTMGSVCLKCNMPFTLNEIQPHHTIAQLTGHCRTIEEAIKELTGESIKAAGPTVSVGKEVAVDAEEGTDIEEKDLESGTPGYRGPTQNSPCKKRNKVDREDPVCTEMSEINARLIGIEMESETPGFRGPTQMNASFKGDDAELETPGFRDPTQIIDKIKKDDNIIRKLSWNLDGLDDRLIKEIIGVPEVDNHIESPILAPQTPQHENFTVNCIENKGNNIVIAESIDIAEEGQHDTISVDKLTSELSQEFEKITPQRKKYLSSGDSDRKSMSSSDNLSRRIGKDVETDRMGVKKKKDTVNMCKLQAEWVRDWNELEEETPKKSKVSTVRLVENLKSDHREINVEVVESLPVNLDNSIMKPVQVNEAQCQTTVNNYSTTMIDTNAINSPRVSSFEKDHNGRMVVKKQRARSHLSKITGNGSEATTSIATTSIDSKLDNREINYSVAGHSRENVILEQDDSATIESTNSRTVSKESRKQQEETHVGSFNKRKTPKKAKKTIAPLKIQLKTENYKTTVPKTIPKNVNKRNAKGESILHTACVKGQKDYVMALLKAGANPNAKDNASWTALQEAVTLGHENICEMLLEWGALPNTPGMDNRTALHDAAINNKLDEAALLLRFNASREVYDKFGKRPIDYVTSDEMRALLTDNNKVENSATDNVSNLNATLDHSILTPNAKVVVLPLNLSNKNKKMLMLMAPKIKFAVAATFRPGVTHVVVETNERNIAELTYNVMLAILEGKWIINSQWIAISSDVNDISDIDLEMFQVRGAPNPETPERARINEEAQKPRLFNNCKFYFTIGVRSSWTYGKLELTKQLLTNLVVAGEGEILNREPNPEDVEDNQLTPFHVAHCSRHPLHKCSRYIIYMPGKEAPRVKYNMPHMKTLPLAWFFECIEKFELVDPYFMGIT